MAATKGQQIMSSIFGGTKRKSEGSSSNLAYGDLSSAFSPLYGAAKSGADSLAKLLGGDASGFNAYKDATGFNFAAEQGSRGITGNAAARNLLRSGSTSKALVGFGNNLQDQYAQSYMDKLLGQAGLGLQAGQVVSGAGEVRKETSSEKSKPGIGGFLGRIGAGFAASDRRLKKNIFKVGELPNGLNLYQFRYTFDDTKPIIGVMADEVSVIQPEALGPVVNGYQTVNYDLINKE
jgi:hypothetical protein